MWEISYLEDCGMRDYGTMEDLGRWRDHFAGTANEFKVIEGGVDDPSQASKSIFGKDMTTLEWSEGRAVPAPNDSLHMLIMNYLIPMRYGVKLKPGKSYLMMEDWQVREAFQSHFQKVPLVMTVVDGRKYLTTEYPESMSEMDRECCSILAAQVLAMASVLDLSDDEDVFKTKFKSVLTDDLDLSLPVKDGLRGMAALLKASLGVFVLRDEDLSSLAMSMASTGELAPVVEALVEYMRLEQEYQYGRVNLLAVPKEPTIADERTRAAARWLIEAVGITEAREICNPTKEEASEEEES